MYHTAGVLSPSQASSCYLMGRRKLPAESIGRHALFWQEEDWSDLIQTERG